MTIDDILRMAPVVPQLTIDAPDLAVPLARTLAGGGLPVLEVTLRSDAALAAVAAIVADVPKAVVGIGAVTVPGDFPRAVAAGVRFASSPGLSRELASAAHAFGLPYLPGVMTPSEMMAAREMGLTHLRFFPAATAGGRPMLKAVGEVLPHLRFCPCGGIGEDNAVEWLVLPNVLCVSGAWLAPPEEVAGRQWDRIASRAAHAARLAHAR